MTRSPRKWQQRMTKRRSSSSTAQHNNVTLSSRSRTLGARLAGFGAVLAVAGLATFPSAAQEETTSTTTTTAATSSTEAETTTTAAESTTTAGDTTTTAPPTTAAPTTEGESTTTGAPTTEAPATSVPAGQEIREDADGGTISEDLAGQLGVWNDRVRAKEGELETAEARLQAAEARLVSTNEEINATRADLGSLEAEAIQRAVSAFMDRDLSELDLNSLSRAQEATRMRTLLQNVVRSDFDVAEELRRAKEDLAIEQAIANEAKAEADAARVFIAEELVELEEARDRKASVTAAAAASLDVATEDDITTVRGFRVRKDVADVVAAMVDDASAAGINLGGGGYRSFESQIEIRKNNCGTSYYAIWEMPSRNCSPPSARPGKSMHERGLALDLTCDGSLIRSRSSKCFQWLASNAEGYGFYNLPSEPWHWSVNGR